MTTANDVSAEDALSRTADERFETLTLGELRIGQRFILLPEPGNDDGHSGYCLLTKMDGVANHPQDDTCARAREVTRETTHEFPLSTRVILIQ
jgi:hypothetical protein